MSNLPATNSNNSIFARFAQTYGVVPSEVSRILKNTAFKVADRNNPTLEVTDEQMVALLVVAEKYRLNPFIREIYAFLDTHGNGITPVIPVDGWIRIANEHPQYDGVEFRDSEKTVKSGNKDVPEWIEATIYRKDRGRPTTIREYYLECTKGSGPWGSHPARMLRHKSFIQAARVAFGFGGVYDDDEAERISNARVVDISQGMQTAIDVTPTLPALSPAEEFLLIVQRAGFADQMSSVEAYLEVCAQHFGNGIDEVKAEICRRPDDFTKTFPAWLKSAKQKQTQKETEKAPAKSGKKTPAEQLPPQQTEPDQEAPRPMQGSMPEKVECKSGAYVRTAVECMKCEDRETNCPHWQG